jgi:vacuolar-type H+-ATPase subunit B/Vma2
MLRYKRITTAILTDGIETIAEILSCPKGRKYRIVSISSAPLANMYLRVYKSAEQIVDAASIVMTTAAPILPMDIRMDVGDVIKAGFYNNGAATTAKEITIGYTDG